MVPLGASEGFWNSLAEYFRNYGNAWFLQGVHHVALDGYHNSLRSLDKGTDLVPRNEALRMEFFTASELGKDWSDPRKLQLATLFSNMSAAHNHNHSRSCAFECCEKALRFRPGYPKALFQRSKMHMAENRMGPAARDLMAVLASVDCSPQLLEQAQKCLDIIREGAGLEMR